ncbi:MULTISPECIES: mechanosensitive ion channel family protein [unclassified Methanosarcina]|uniref:mechanosensitive ion channel family protein n=1 Tax=unclassified Methanosarcina TaxID=2644672 RepID=UPI00061617A9|nr:MULTISPECIES: mechanosensitive ion channel domain-containing protein [unclassified Methanosarcina]AKB18334.1 Potassium efflux system KefA protein [Methanosarcina sp. WWM596]AKB22152.1 Potassium efflux system KefA protein [Methanosarcina sp. WH1]
MVDVNESREQLLETLTSIDTQTLITIVLIFLFAYVLARIITTLLSKLSEKMNRGGRIKVKIIIPIVKFAIYVIAFYYIFGEIFKIFGAEILLLTGILGAAIGFGIKDLFSDLIAGLVITFEKPYQIGDKISMGNYYGEVADISLRATKLVTPDDNTVTVPNSLIFNEAVASGNYGASEMMVVIDLYIAGESNVETAMRILREAVVSSKYVYISKKSPVVMLYKAFPFYTRLRAKAYVNDLRDQFKFESDVHTRTWIEFQKNGIRAPQLNFLNISSIEGNYELDVMTRRNFGSNAEDLKESK